MAFSIYRLIPKKRLSFLSAQLVKGNLKQRRPRSKADALMRLLDRSLLNEQENIRDEK